MEGYAMTACRECGVQQWVFTFGSSHTHPDTGESLGRCYVRIPAPSYEAARVEMVRLFGLKWSFQYDSPERAGVTKYSLREVALPKMGA